MTPIKVRRLPRVGTRGVRSGAFAYHNDPQGSLFGSMNGHALRVAGIGITVDTEGLIAELRNTAAMRRTADIRQFDFKRFPLPTALGLGGPGAPFRHSRFDHMIGAGAISQLIVHNNRDAIPQVQHESLVAYDTTHDVSSMAGNDGVKLVRPGHFEEDAHYRESFLRDPGIAMILARHKADPALMAQLAAEEHPLFKVLHDMVDRISYVSGDVAEFERLAGANPHASELAEDDPIRKIHELSRPVDGIPIGSLWEKVRFDNEGAYILDGEHLARFLELRANLFAGIYLNPQSRGADHTAAIALVRYCFAQGLVSVADLLKMDDTALMNYLKAISGFDRTLAERGGIMPSPTISLHGSAKDARQEAARLIEAGNITLVEDCSRGSGTAVSWRIKKKSRVKPLRELMPEAAARIETAMAKSRRVMLFSLTQAQLTSGHGIDPHFADKLMKFERERIRN